MFLRKISLLLIALGLFLTVSTQAQNTIKTKADSISYSIGINIGQNILNQFSADTIPFDAKIIAQGLIDGATKATPKLTQDQMAAVLATFQQEMQVKSEAKRARMEAERKVAGEVNKKAGEEFLAKNKKEAGVQTTASGLQYKVITMGKGPKPTATNEVKVHYKGTLTDGKVFDSSIDRGEPVTFQVGGVIKGWTEALQLMPEGSKWMLYIPSELAYGERGAGQMIGPNAVLIFEVELLQVIAKEANDQIQVKPITPDKKGK